MPTIDEVVADAIQFYGKESNEDHWPEASYIPEEISKSSIAKLIDHTILDPTATRAAVKKACDEAIQHEFYGVCVYSSHLDDVNNHLLDTGIRAISVVGFPSGAIELSLILAEAELAIRSLATELDMVIPLGALKSGDYETVYKHIYAVVQASEQMLSYRAVVKVIVEAAALSRHELIAACAIAKTAGADFVKTSTGFGPGGAREEDVRVMRAVVGPKMGVKASGGIKTWEQARRMLEAGASRIGTSSGVAIVAEL